MTLLSGYRIMWLVVYFDLPTNTKKARRAYTRFRKSLLEDGFTMYQYSVYLRHCASRENADVHIRRVHAALPERGVVSILTITDKQYGEIKNFWGIKRTPLPPEPKQLEFF
jgi:CRISPR-associated protein Cas2